LVPEKTQTTNDHNDNNNNTVTVKLYFSVSSRFFTSMRIQFAASCLSDQVSGMSDQLSLILSCLPKLS
jgi:hypothetical protein